MINRNALYTLCKIQRFYQQQMFVTEKSMQN